MKILPTAPDYVPATDVAPGGVGQEASVTRHLYNKADNQTSNDEQITGVGMPGNGVNLLAFNRMVASMEVMKTTFDASTNISMASYEAGWDNATFMDDGYEYLVSLLAGDGTITGSSFGDKHLEVGAGGTATINSGLGDDVVYVWHQKDIDYNGGDGVDSLSFRRFTGANVLPTTQGAVINLATGAVGQNPFGGTVTFTSIENVLSYSEHGDSLTGNDGDNRLDCRFGGGNDTLIGAGGNDIISISANTFDNLNPGSDGIASEDSVDGGAGTDLLQFFTTGFAASNVLDLLTPASNTGTFAGDSIQGIEIFERMSNGDGAVWVFRGSDSAEYVIGANSNGQDDLDGRGGDDTLEGGTGADTLNGGSGNDTFALGSEADGIDTIIDTSGIDTITTTMSRSLAGYAAIENLTLVTSDFLNNNFNGTGNNLANVLTGNIGNNALSGGLGADTVMGGSGNDTVTGGSGRDVLTGSAGNDRFVFTKATDSSVGAARDVISDFSTAGTLERIDLSGFAGKFIFRGTGAFTSAAHEISYKFVGANTLVRIDLDGDRAAEMEILLSGHKVLGAFDFYL